MSTKAQRKRFERQLREMLLKLGAIENPGRWYELSLDTPAGTLELSPNPGWLAGRFVDPEHAKRFVDCNPYSGKWNFHDWGMMGGEPEPAIAAIWARIKTLLCSDRREPCAWRATASRDPLGDLEQGWRNRG